MVALVNNIHAARSTCTTPHIDKSYRQLLTLTLSAISVLDEAQLPRLNSLIDEQLSASSLSTLKSLGVFDGLPQSGNQAMFQAIFLLHAKMYLGYSVQSQIEQWVELHLRSMNEFGFWGKKGLTHLQFQNGYHQYEIFEYLKIDDHKMANSVQSVNLLVDDDGHFSPYPGGGACFDYDGIFLLTPNGKLPQSSTAKETLIRTFDTLINEQGEDGGFCENLLLRPRYKAITAYFGKILTSTNWALFQERVRYAITLQRFKYDKLTSHWSATSREWSQSDLFSSWFRLLTLARIECAFCPDAIPRWGFINYPGIGYHPSLAKYETSTAATSDVA